MHVDRRLFPRYFQKLQIKDKYSPETHIKTNIFILLITKFPTKPLTTKIFPFPSSLQSSEKAWLELSSSYTAFPMEKILEQKDYRKV